ncbi:MAG: hypothetical protein ABJI69_09155 [Balneola sp.]
MSTYSHNSGPDFDDIIDQIIQVFLVFGCSMAIALIVFYVLIALGIIPNA